MIARNKAWMWGGVALAGVWLVAAAGIWLLRAQRITAEKTVDFLHHHSLRGLAAGDRRAVIDGLADRVNQLSFEERQKFRLEGQLRRWFEELDEQERRHYLDRTLPKGMKQMMEAFNNMPSAKRKQLVNRALNDLDRFRGEHDKSETDAALSNDNVKWMIDQGMKSFYSDASADTKLDLQPFIEQLQQLMQSGR